MRLVDAYHLAHVQIKDYKLLQHCVMVSNLAGKAAYELGYDVELCMCAGLLHDIGKTRTSCITYHPTLSYIMLDSIDKDVAVLALYHHQFQQYQYPKMECNPADYKLYELAQLISLCDKVEAYMTRSNCSPDEAVDCAVNEYPFDHELVMAVRGVVTAKEEGTISI